MDLKEVRQLVFKGGGAKGLAYLGALKEFEKHASLSQIESFAGTSAGAITAMLLAFGYGTEEITKIITGIDWKEWLDEEWGVVRDLHNLRTNLGWCRSEVPKRWIRDQVREALGSENATFHDLQHLGNRGLVVVAFNTSRQVPVYFGHEDWTLDTPIADAVLASMSIPFVWEPVLIDGDQYIDGGMIDNYPIHLWDHGQPSMLTLGFWVDNAARIDWIKRGILPPTKGATEDFLEYAQRVVGGATTAETLEHIVDGRDHKRTVYIDTPIQTLQLDLSEKDIQNMIGDGQRGFQDFLRKKKVRPVGEFEFDPRD